MKKFLLCTVSLALFLGATGDGWAQGRKSKKGKKVRVGKTVYDFSEVDILGRLKRPEGQSVVVPPEFQFQRLLDLDESFLPNIVRGVDEF